MNHYRLDLIGDRIRTQRKSCKLTQEKLAEIVKVHVRTVKSWEGKEHAKPDLETLGELATALRCDVAYLIGENDTPRRKEADIAAVTGFSETAAKGLCNILDHSTKPVLEFLVGSSGLDAFQEILFRFIRYAKTFSEPDRFTSYDMDAMLFQASNLLVVLMKDYSKEAAQNGNETSE